MTLITRGIRQWNKVSRYVKRGSKCLYILVPFIKKVEDRDKEKQVLIGFGTKAVFRVEDTDGEPLEYENIELPRFPLIDRAEAWNIDIRAVPSGTFFVIISFEPSCMVRSICSKRIIARFNWSYSGSFSFSSAYESVADIKQMIRMTNLIDFIFSIFITERLKSLDPKGTGCKQKAP